MMNEPETMLFDEKKKKEEGTKQNIIFDGGVWNNG
jgi:hypothetical protein